MAIPDQALVAKLQGEFVDRMMNEMKRATEGRERPPKEVVRDAKARAEELQKRIETAERDRDDAARGWDERIVRYKKELVQLRKQADEIERGLHAASDGEKRKAPPKRGSS